MQNGLYVATSGLLMQQRRVDVTANNIANVNTQGFKKELAVFSPYEPVDERIPQNVIRESLYNKTINATVKLDDIHTSFKLGAVKETGKRFDFALGNEKSFFAVDTPFGVRFTRGGQFTLDNEGQLVTHDGFKVLTTGDDFASQLPDGLVVPNVGGADALTVTEDGGIYLDQAFLGTLSVVEFDDPSKLQKVGRNLYVAVDIIPVESVNPAIKQGYLELSNVEAVGEMVRMIDALRGFEMYQKVVSTYDEINTTAATKIAQT